ncbi:peroxisomal biogenesis factor 11 [Syncephalis fuscata]|nr:peroxisomal biogenesis factor 11 [Syncephalis fuscata]
MPKSLNVEAQLRFAATTVGRDKVYRFVQYFARFLAYYLAQRGTYSKETIQRLANLKSSIGLARKLMRVGKPIEHLQTLFKSLNQRDEVLRVLSVGRSASLGIYLVYDMFQWVSKHPWAGVYRFQNIRSIAQKAARFWMIGIALNLIASAYKLRQTTCRQADLQRAIKAQGGHASANEDTRLALRQIRKEKAGIQRQLVQDGFDILIPSTTLEYTGLNDGLVGLAGTITSLMGIKSQWQKVNSK